MTSPETDGRAAFGIQQSDQSLELNLPEWRQRQPSAPAPPHTGGEETQGPRDTEERRVRRAGWAAAGWGSPSKEEWCLILRHPERDRCAKSHCADTKDWQRPEAKQLAPMKQ